MSKSKRMWASRDDLVSFGGPRVQLWIAKPILRKLGKKRGFCSKQWAGTIIGEYGLEIGQCIEIEPIVIRRKAAKKAKLPVRIAREH